MADHEDDYAPSSYSMNRQREGDGGEVSDRTQSGRADQQHQERGRERGSEEYARSGSAFLDDSDLRRPQNNKHLKSNTTLSTSQSLKSQTNLNGTGTFTAASNPGKVTGTGMGLTGASGVNLSTSAAGGVEVEVEERERMFHKLAPPLNEAQKYLVLISFVADLARSVLVSKPSILL
jgi:hypothetical protein